MLCRLSHAHHSLPDLTPNATGLAGLSLIRSDGSFWADVPPALLTAAAAPALSVHAIWAITRPKRA
ncbi:hypothetical protein GCM10028799_83330 [Kribbella italica]